MSKNTIFRELLLFLYLAKKVLLFVNQSNIIGIATDYDKSIVLIYRSINGNNSIVKSHKCSLENKQKKPKKLINIHFKKGYFMFMLNCIRWAIA